MRPSKVLLSVALTAVAAMSGALLAPALASSSQPSISAAAAQVSDLTIKAQRLTQAYDAATEALARATAATPAERLVLTQRVQTAKAAVEKAIAAERLYGQSMSPALRSALAQRDSATQAANRAASARLSRAAAMNVTSAASTASAAALKAISFAYAQLGKPYQYGAAGPNSYDCSGLTMAAYASAGVSLSRTAASQWSSGPHISQSSLIPGDLLFFGSSPGSIYHVQLYIGNGRSIAAPHTGDVVKIVDGLYSGYLGASRPTAAVAAVAGPLAWKLRNSTTSGDANVSFLYGISTDVPLVGDWNGNRTATPGVRRGAIFYLKNTDAGGSADLMVQYGLASDRPMVGDWDGNGTTTIGVRRGNVFYLRNSNTDGPADITIAYGTSSDAPVVGDWDGNRTTTIGVRRGNTFYLSNSNTRTSASKVVGYGLASDAPVVGDWDGNRSTTIGVRRGNTLYLVNAIRGGSADIVATYGTSTDKPALGDWDGNRTVTFGITRRT